MAIFGPNLLTFQLCLCSASLTIRVLIPLFNGTYLFQIGKKMPEVRGRRPRRFEKTLDQWSIPSSDRKQILPSPLHGDRTKANRMPCILSKDQPSDRASNAQNACPPQAFLEKLARFPHSLIRTSPPPLQHSWCCIHSQTTNHSLVRHPAWKSFTCVLPCRCGGSNGKNSVAAYGVSESWAGPQGPCQGFL